MALPTTFGLNTNSTGAQLDQALALVGALTTLQCTASGTNAITLTPGANQPAISAYGLPNPVRFGFTAVASSTNSVTLAVVGSGGTSIGALNVYLPGGSQAGSGDIVLGSYYEVVYLLALNSGAGGFLIVSASPASGTSPVGIAGTRNLKIVNNTITPNTQIDITAASATMATSSGTPIFSSPVSVTIDLTTTGANGMDTGSRPTSGWVYLYLISNGTTTAGLASATSPTSGAPTMPSGYTYSGYVGAMYCDASQNLKRTIQRGNRAQYTVVSATNTAAMPTLASGAAGAVGTGPTVAVDTTSLVPLTAGEIFVTASSTNGSSIIVLAPNNAYGGQTSTTNPPFVVMAPSGASLSTALSMLLESTNIYWASSSSTGLLACSGWIDTFMR